MEQPPVKAVPRHQGCVGQRAAAGTVGSQQVAQSSDVERSQLHRTAAQERQLGAEEGGKKQQKKMAVMHLVDGTSLSRGLTLMHVREGFLHHAATVAQQHPPYIHDLVPGENKVLL